MRTGLDSSPEITKPAIARLSPEPTRARVEMFTSRWSPRTASPPPARVAVIAPETVADTSLSAPMLAVTTERPVLTVSKPAAVTVPVAPSAEEPAETRA